MSREIDWTRLSIDADVTAVLTWVYETGGSRLTALYENAKAAQWNATTDIDWTIDLPYGSPLPDGSDLARRSFLSSPLGDRGRAGWDEFRWEVQGWTVSQFLHGEQAAMVASARLAELLPNIDAKYYAISQAGDEARHTEAFARYVDLQIPEPYPLSPALKALFTDALSASSWDITAIAIQSLVEPIALAGFRMAGSTFHDDLVKRIVAKIAQDEARHVSFGVLLLNEALRELTSAELASREEFVLEAVSLMRTRFLMAEVWERFGVPVSDGTAFAAVDPGLSAFRRTLFSRLVPMLAHIGLLTPRVVDGLTRMDLLDRAAVRTVRRVLEETGVSNR
ncbi:ferritin-like domain-containing protein [Lentzea sp. NPDC004782]|uniref:ferritin-like domain-containing protein n=1 Tax=Lentzea sp. NPDC004782 TaxID=3154458 RepID=UPI0033AFBB8B